MERQLLEWLEMIGLELRETGHDESNTGRFNAVSKLRRRIEDAYRRRGNSKRKKKRSRERYSKSENLDNDETTGASASGTGHNQSGKLIYGFLSE